jgi:hypothetical protein
MNAPGENVDVVLKNMATSDSQVKMLASQPLQDFNIFIMNKNRSEIGMSEVNREIAFDVSSHEASNCCGS